LVKRAATGCRSLRYYDECTFVWAGKLKAK
jgi:hypothetical protein